MAKFKEIIYGLLEDLKGYNVTDDNLMHPDIIAALLNDIRATLIHQEKYIDGMYYQMYPCLEVKCDTNKCVIDGVEIKGDKIYYVEPPALIKSMGTAAIKFLGNASQSAQFFPSDYAALSMLDHMPYGGRKKAYAIMGEKILDRKSVV